MGTPFLGEIRIFAFPFPPRFWAFCEGQILPISQNTPLFSILGTAYGGNGQTTFALPDLRDRSPIHQGQGAGLSAYALGQQAGAASVTLLPAEIPQHNHLANCVDAAGDSYTGSGDFPAIDAGGNNCYSGTAGSAMAAGALATAGGSQPHNNMQPSLALSFCIALQGIFPSTH